MEPGKIVYRGKTKKGTDITIRYPSISDLKPLRCYINTLSKERTFITFQGEQLSLESEEKYLKSFLEKTKKRQAVKLIVFTGKKLIGVADIKLDDKSIDSHIGAFGITIHKNYRGEGIGKLLMKLVLETAKDNLKGMKLVILSVFGNNPVARRMYQKFGFIDYGNLPKGVLHRGRYVDHYYMYKKLSSRQ
ncbi:MAG: GNAT family N-acetyltransferase [bacterium]